MECLSCKHNASDELFGDPAKCPECGVYQAKARAHKERLEKIQENKDSDSQASLNKKTEEKSDSNNLSYGNLSAGYAGKSLDALIRYPGARPVVVVDFRMGFWSMVKFMVKWAIAAIPALFLLIFIGVFFGSFLSGILTGMGADKRLELLKKDFPDPSGAVADQPIVGKGPVNLEVLGVSYVKTSEDSGMLDVKMSMFSNSEKDIRSLEGKLMLSDRDGNIIGVVPFKASVNIPARRSSWWSGTIFISSILPGFTALKALTSDCIATFEPRQIGFSDGTVQNF